jgi:hypothetical protein
VLFGRYGTEKTGNLTLPSESSVLLNITYGTNGTEYSGNYKKNSDIITIWE